VKFILNYFNDFGLVTHVFKRTPVILCAVLFFFVVLVFVHICLADFDSSEHGSSLCHLICAVGTKERKTSEFLLFGIWPARIEI